MSIDLQILPHDFSSSRSVGHNNTRFSAQCSLAVFNTEKTCTQGACSYYFPSHTYIAAKPLYSCSIAHRPLLVRLFDTVHVIGRLLGEYNSRHEAGEESDAWLARSKQKKSATGCSWIKVQQLCLEYFPE
jgi:hypothetical protein